MEKTIRQVGPVEFELEIEATAAELATDVERIVRAQQAKTRLKGFRPGKVPLAMVKKIYGDALAMGVAERSVSETYKVEVVDSESHEVLGQPTITELDYRIDGDLRAVVRFGTRPNIDLVAITGETVTKPIRDITDEDVEREVLNLRRRSGEMVANDGEIEDADIIFFDAQKLDEATKTTIIGERTEGIVISMDDPSIDPVLADVIRGRKAGDTVRVALAAPEGVQPALQGLYDISVREVKRLDMPDADDSFAAEVSNGTVETIDALYADIRRRLESSWSDWADEVLHSNIVERMIALHTIDLPESIVSLYLDSFIEDVRRRNENKLPEGFDEHEFRTANRDEAEKQAKWALIRDEVIRQESISVTDQDRRDYFASEASEKLPVEALEKYYASVPGMKEQLDRRLLSKKVFARLGSRFTVVGEPLPAVAAP